MPNRLSKLFSSSEKEKEALAEHARANSSPSPPPEYNHAPPGYDPENIEDPPDLTSGFNNLSLEENPANEVPTPEECVAHLKVLECFYRLRQSIGALDGFAGILDNVVTDIVPEDDAQRPELLAKLAEKRWSIYVHRAAYRFEKWYQQLASSSRMPKLKELEEEGPKGELCEPQQFSGQLSRINEHIALPVDVLMVWHAFMLNPRTYLEDCLRSGMMNLWHTRFPWKTIVDRIDSETFIYEVDRASKVHFFNSTGLSWDNLDDRNERPVECPDCDARVLVPWSTCSEWASQEFKSSDDLPSSIDKMLSSGYGFCDREFSAVCDQCANEISHASLEVRRFKDDLKLLIKYDIPLRGSLFGQPGIPWSCFGVTDHSMRAATLPNALFQTALGTSIIFDKNLKNMEGVRTHIETKFYGFNGGAERARASRSIPQIKYNLKRLERMAVRRMMSRYWNNSSYFALDLVGAVIRQGSFIEKMHNIDWLHSPALPNTMKRLLVKYERFMDIIAKYPLHMAVPTLDVDLAWHTHQLSPYAYMKHTVGLTRQFIDHDDKVAETKLNDSFAWTSKTYQKLHSEPYSECTCWYCEAIRESHTSSASRLFNTTSSRVNEHPTLHSSPDSAQNPSRSVHISAHNAVRPSDTQGRYELLADTNARNLEKHYQKACERARKKGRKEPRRDDYYYSDAWGYPVYIPAYSPYVGVVPYAPLYYPVSPGCMALGPGAAGNCCAGTCGGAVAAGGCSAGGGSCAGGPAGGCYGGGGGACGGGSSGGSGCGGGGGGCGGGGGGGCGGGGC